MNNRNSNATALRRLMTEYKQLTANGTATSLLLNILIMLSICTGAPDNMFTAGPVSESDMFTWEALICGPKDTPFVRFFSF